MSIRPEIVEGIVRATREIRSATGGIEPEALTDFAATELHANEEFLDAMQEEGTDAEWKEANRILISQGIDP